MQRSQKRRAICKRIHIRTAKRRDLMDIQRIYADIKLHSSLDNSILIKFSRQCGKFFQEMDANIEQLNPCEAVEVLSLLIYFETYFLFRDEWERTVYRSLEKVRDGIYAGTLLPPAVFGGISHVLFIIKELSYKVNGLDRFMNSLNNLLTARILPYIDVTNPNFYNIDNFELIAGLSGVLRCCLDGELTEENQTMSNSIVDALIARLHPRVHLGYPIPGFHYYPSKLEKQYINNPSENGYINYGISHGMAGPLCALSIAYGGGACSEKIRPTLEYLIEELLNTKYYVNNIIYWPGRISFEQYIGKDTIQHVPNRMSWCYGSIGILRALYLAGKALSNDRICTFAAKEMKKIAELDTKEYLLNSPIVCHGLAGVALVMMKMYEDTQNGTFLDKAQRLVDDLIYNFTNRYTENKHLMGLEEITKYSFLEGYAGALQTIFSRTSSTANVNEKRLLLL